MRKIGLMCFKHRESMRSDISLRAVLRRSSHGPSVMISRTMLVTLAFMASILAGALAETLSLPLTASVPIEATIDSKVDDSNFRDPIAYRHHGAASRVFQKRLTLTNTGVVPLTGPLLIINDNDGSSVDSLRRSLQPNAPPQEWVPRLFALWCNRVSHADSDAPGGKEPFALLNFWGYALCGDTTAAMTHIATSQGVAARKIPLNGHVAAEYFFHGAWHILDTDQNVAYLQLDNRTLASAADLRADPFLARRTKALGRYAPMDFAASAFNTSLHEFIQPKDDKTISHKKAPASVRADTLLPGEKMIVHFDEAPEQPVGKTDLNQWETVRVDALCLVEFAIDPKARQGATPGEAVFAAGYPILRAVNRTSGETVTTPASQPTFDIKVKFRSPDDQISIYCQRAKASLPIVRKGRNAFLLAAADKKGKATLAVDWERAPSNLTPPVVTAALVDDIPSFAIKGAAAEDLVWWQVSADSGFDFVPPNFDSIAPAAEKIAFDPLTATFLSPGQSYFLRIKGRHSGIWGEWSAPLEFRMAKPSRPSPAQTVVTGSRLRLTWPDAGPGCEYLLFGSNRLDFLPEPYATKEIVRLRNQAIEESRPNKNLITVLAKPEFELDPEFRFYRVITRRSGILSVPGDIIITPAALAAKLPPPMILQDRWQRVSDPKNPGAETDEHLATELPLR